MYNLLKKKNPDVKAADFIAKSAFKEMDTDKDGRGEEYCPRAVTWRPVITGQVPIRHFSTSYESFERERCPGLASEKNS